MLYDTISGVDDHIVDCDNCKEPMQDFVRKKKAAFPFLSELDKGLNFNR